MTFKNIRITLLLVILGYIVLDSFLSSKRATEWKHPLRVVIYPINADGREITDKYISTLTTSQFESFTTLLKKESSRYGLSLSSPISVQLSAPIKSLPPAIPKDRNRLNVMWWSLKLRYWTWKTDNFKGLKPQVRAYALFFDPKVHKGLAHSTGLEKSKVALIQLFADDKHAKQNNFIILHELLHTLGATDKYDLSTNQPLFPEGYAEPNRKPTYPQHKAEIMGGRIPLSQTKAKMPSSLQNTVIGTKTAKEIGWVK
ncbi:MAG: hypothetical protein L3J51_05960 [Cocleimonas sp.]|nr:hypothetical protein [Cocleimonas sp.]